MKKIFISILVLAACFMQSYSQEYITFSHMQGVDYSHTERSITKTAADGWGNAGAISANCIRVSTDGYVFLTDVPTDQLLAVGLSTSPSNYDVQNMDYALEFDNGTLIVKNFGLDQYNHGTFTSTDEFIIKRSSGYIIVEINGSPVFTSGSTLTGTLTADIALHDLDGKIGDIVIDFPRCDPTTGAQFGSVQRELDDSYYYTHNGVLKVLFIEEYFSGVDTKISYDIYDAQMNVVASVDYSGTPSSGSPNPYIYEGENRLSLNLNGLNLTYGDFYNIIFYNKKLEKRYMTFQFMN